ncbi:MAG: hypothetical protein AAFZ99_18970 [Pseudomonadota bacterium]
MSHISPHARLFEFIRQSDLAERRYRSRPQTAQRTPTPDDLAAFQQVALQSLDRSAD